MRAWQEAGPEKRQALYPDYEAVGLKRNDEYIQLSTTLIQIENEFYGTIRPKRPTEPGERPLNALLTRGVEYVENEVVRLSLCVCQCRRQRKGRLPLAERLDELGERNRVSSPRVVDDYAEAVG